MTAALLLAALAALALAAAFGARRAPLPSRRTAGGVALMLASPGLAAARQFALALPVGFVALGLLARRWRRGARPRSPASDRRSAPTRSP